MPDLPTCPNVVVNPRRHDAAAFDYGTAPRRHLPSDRPFTLVARSMGKDRLIEISVRSPRLPASRGGAPPMPA